MFGEFQQLYLILPDWYFGKKNDGGKDKKNSFHKIGCKDLCLHILKVLSTAKYYENVKVNLQVS